MNNTAKILGGLALLWYGVFRGASAMIVNIKSFMIRSIDVANRTMDITLNFLIKNPLFVGLTLNRLKGNVYIQGVNVGEIDTELNYHLSGGYTHIVPVAVHLGLSELGQAAILNIQSGDIRTITIAFAGHLYVGRYNVAVPVEMTLNWNDLTK